MQKYQINNSNVIQKIFLLLAIILLSFSLIIGCGSSGGKDDGESGTNGETETPDETVYNLTGTVLNENGSPVSDVEVLIFSPKETTTTDSEGKFAFETSEERHTVIISRPGYVDTYRIVDIPSGVIMNQPLLLQESAVSEINVLAKAGGLVLSNQTSTKLEIPANSGTFTVGKQSGLSNTNISVEYIDLTRPLPVPLPSPDTLSAADVKIGGKQAPYVMVAIKPALLNLQTPVTLYMANPKDLTNLRVLRFDPEKHLWVETGYKTPAEPQSQFSFPINKGGIYGIFFEEQRTASLRGIATPGSVVFAGDEIITVPSDGKFYVSEMPIPPDNEAVTISSVEPETKSVVTLTLEEGTLQTGALVKDIDISHITIAEITLRADRETLAAGKEDSTRIYAEVKGADGEAVLDGTRVEFSTSGGTLSAKSASTQNSIASVVLTSSDTEGTATVTAKSGSISSSMTISFVTAPHQFSISASKTSIKSDNTDSTTITVTVTDNKYAALEGITVEFEADGGKISSPSQNTDAEGKAEITFTSGSIEKEAKEVTITASVEGLESQSIKIQVTGAAAKFSIATSQTTVKSDNSDNATITATVQDNNNAALEGVTVSFWSDGGKISAASEVTDENGQAEITFSSGTVDKSNRIVNIEASVAGLGSRRIPVQVTGTEITLATDRTNLGKGVLTITVKDAGTKAIYDAEVILTSVDTTDLSQENDNLRWELLSDYKRYILTDTDFEELKNNGVGDALIEKLTPLKDKEYTGEDTFLGFVEESIGEAETKTYKDLILGFAEQAGVFKTDVTGKIEFEIQGREGFRDEAMLKVRSMGVTVTQAYTVSSGGEEFKISKLVRVASDGQTKETLSLSKEVISLHTNEKLEVTVSAPKRNNVKFSTSFGTWEGTDGKKTYDTQVNEKNEAYATLIPDQAGLATIQVIDNDATDVSDSIKVAISAPSIDAAKIAIQSSASVVDRSTGDMVNSVIIKAVVKNANDQVVEGSPVLFSIENTTNGGEYISPIIVYTDNYGTAETTFYSGSLSSSAQGVQIIATLVDKPDITDSVSIVIGNVPTSVTISVSSKVASINSDTQYEMPMSVIVTDANGNPMTGIEVTLGLWPTRYATGYWVEVTSGECQAAYTGIFPNEDKNKNLECDNCIPCEDNQNPDNEDVNGDCELTPLNSAAGSIPSVKTTDENGVAEFSLIYPKNSAAWVEDQIVASTMVAGTETRSTYTFWLGWLAGEECSLSHSPYNRDTAGEPEKAVLTATPENLTADGSSESIIEALVTDADGNPVSDGTTIKFELSGTGKLSYDNGFTQSGVATTSYIASKTSGTATITAKDTSNNVLGSVNVYLIEPNIAGISISAGASNIVADGTSQVLISAEVWDTSGSAVKDGTRVTFKSTAGSIASSVYTANGIASTMLTSSSKVGTATVTATVGGVSNTVRVSFVPGPVFQIKLKLTPDTLPADGSTTSEIRAEVMDVMGNAIDGETVSFSVSIKGYPDKYPGTLSAPTATTSGGVATVTYTASLSVGQAEIRVETANSTYTVGSITLSPTDIGNMSITAEPTEVDVVLGDNTPTEANESVITVQMVYNDGSPVVDVPITFKDATSVEDEIPLPDDNTYEGSGNKVTTAFHSDGGITTFTMSHAGTTSSVFMVYLWNREKNERELLENEKGNIVNASRVSNLESGNYFLEIIASRAWSVKVEGNIREVPQKEATVLAIVNTVSKILDDGKEVGEATYTFPYNQIEGGFTSNCKIAGMAKIIAELGESSVQTEITLRSGPPTQIEVTANPEQIYSNESQATIMAKVRDENNNVAGDDIPVTFVTNNGKFENDTQTIEVLTDTGISTTALISPVSGTSSSATVRGSLFYGTENEVSQDVQIDFLGISLTDMKATPGSIVANGTDTSSITIRLKDANGIAVEDETIRFTTTNGTIQVQDVQTDPDGIATATLIAPTVTGSATVTASYGLLTSEIQVTFQESELNIGSLTLETGADSIVADRDSQTLITATVTDDRGDPIKDGINVTFSTTAGTITNVTATANGVATAMLRSSETVGTATVTATVGGKSQTVSVQFIPGKVATISLSATPNKLSADGSSTSEIRAEVLDEKGNAIDDEVISFKISSGNGKLSAPTATTSGGVATVTYTSSETAGTVTIQAKSANNVSSNSVNISVAPTGLGDLSVSATKTEITVVLGDDAATANNQTTITATLEDSEGNPVSGSPITFKDVSNIGDTDAWPDDNTVKGTGKASSPSFYTKGGTVIFTITSTEDAANNFTVWLWNSDTNQRTLIENIVGPITNDVKQQYLDSGTYFLEIDAVNDWIIEASGNIESVPEATGKELAIVDTGTDGRASFTYTSSATAGVITIRAESGDMSADIDIKQVSGPVHTIELSADPSSIYANAYNTSTLTATVRDENNNPVEEAVTVRFTTSSGTLDGPFMLTETVIGDIMAAMSADLDEAEISAVKNKLEKLKDIQYENNEELTDAIKKEIETTIEENLISKYEARFISYARIKDPKPQTSAGVATIPLIAPVSSTNSTATVTASVLDDNGEDMVIDSKTVSAEIKVRFKGVTLSDMIVDPPTIYLSGSGEDPTSATITVRLKDADGVAIEGEQIYFFITVGSGTIKTDQPLTDEDGVAQATFIAPAEGTNATVQAKYGLATNSPSAQRDISFKTPIQEKVANITLTADPETLPADGESKSTITAFVTQVGGSPVSDETKVTFEILQDDPDDDVGTLGAGIETSTYTVNGYAYATLTSGLDATDVTIQVTAGDKTQEIEVEYTEGSIELVIVPNSVLGTGEEPENSATATARLTKSNGDSVGAGVAVKFDVDDLSLGSIDRQVLTDSRGIAIATFLGKAKGGEVTITATWTTEGGDISQSETVIINPPPAYINVTDGFPLPTSINIKGTGGQSTSQISFDVKDSDGELVADGYRIDFEITDGPGGGEVISPLYALTSGGTVSTVLRSGFKSGTVSITATYFYDSNVSTSTSQIAIVAGQPVGEEFGIGADFLNVSGLWKFGLEDVITISAGDIYGNSIPDNTAISFKTYNTGGLFDPGTAHTTDGFTSNPLFTSNSPKPMQGFVSVTAEAINGGKTMHVTCLDVVPKLASYPEYSQILYAGTDGGGVYRSLDSGATWENISRSSEQQGQNWIDPYVNDIAVDPDNPNRVYAATGYLGKGNVYRSLDGGLNWNSGNSEEWTGIFSASNAVLTILCDDDGCDEESCSSGNCYREIEYYDEDYKLVSEYEKIPCFRHVWIGTDTYGAYYAEDGVSFKWSEGLQLGSIVNDIVKVNGTHGSSARLYAGTASGVYKSTDGGRSWMPTTQFTGNYINTIAVHPVSVAEQDVVYAGTEGAGIWVSINSGESWQDISTVEMGEGLSATVPSGSKGNKGTGVISEVTVFENSESENWTLVCQGPTEEDGTYFTVEGSISGEQGKDYYFTDTATIPVPGENVGNGTMSEVTVSYGAAERFQDDVWTVSCSEKDTDNTVFEITGSNLGTPSFKLTEQDLNRISEDVIYYQLTEDNLTTLDGDPDITDDTITNLQSIKNIRYETKESFLSVLETTINDQEIYNDYNALILQYAKKGQDILDNLKSMQDVAYKTEQEFSDALKNSVGDENIETYKKYARTYNLKEVKYEIPDLFEFTITPGTTPFQVGDKFTFKTIRHEEKYSIQDVMEFTITQGTKVFETGDTFTFSTTRDEGRIIKDLLVDAQNNLLYAVTYFWGETEPHAVGNVFVRELDEDGTIPPGDWKEANLNLPPYDSPDDMTLFAQHVIAANVKNYPTALFIGGEGINMYKASDGLASGEPSWQASKSGLTNRIMARMPILFSGECTMSVKMVELNRDENLLGPQDDNVALEYGDVITFHVYIQDTNGNPPVGDSTFLVIIEYPTYSVTEYTYAYEDSYQAKGTFRDLDDKTTNNPIVVTVTVDYGTIRLIFTPKCSEDAPGCSGGTQTQSYKASD